MNAPLTYRIEDGVLDVRLQREPLNEIGVEMLVALEEVRDIIQAERDDVRAVVISSKLERGFSAGADLPALHAGFGDLRLADRAALRAHVARLYDGPRATLDALRETARHTLLSRARPDLRRAAKVFAVRTFLDRIHRVFDAFDTAPVPVIAAVHGACFGGGFELALTADVIVADKSARFAFPELRLGLIPGFGGIPRLERDLGNAAVRDLLLSGRSVGAKRAHELGLCAQLTGEGHAYRTARRLALQMTRFDRRATETAKRFIKPHPKARLEEEKARFTELLVSPVVERALDRFVTQKDDPFSYLPGTA